MFYELFKNELDKLFNELWLVRELFDYFYNPYLPNYNKPNYRPNIIVKKYSAYYFVPVFSYNFNTIPAIFLSYNLEVIYDTSLCLLDMSNFYEVVNHGGDLNLIINKLKKYSYRLICASIFEDDFNLISYKEEFAKANGFNSFDEIDWVI